MDKAGWVRNLTRRRLWSAAVVVALAGTLAVQPMTPALVATATGPSSISLDEPFTGTTLNDPSAWISIRGGTLNEWPCLTAATVSLSASTGIVEACEDQNGPAAVATGEGALRLTRNYGTAGSNAAGTLLYNTSLSASEGIDISFAIRMDDGNVADGMSFFLKDGSNVTNSSGTAGGALGYALTSGTNGVPGALFGIGFDKLGNFSSNLVSSVSCPVRGTFGSFSPPASEANRIVLRGPDTSGAQNGSSGYCYLGATTSAFSSTAFQRVRVVVPPYTAGQPTTVSVYLAPSVTPDVLPLAPTLTSAVTISATSFKFGFSAATGLWTNNHDVRGLVIRPAGPAITSVASSESTGSGTGPTSGGSLLTITGTSLSASATVTVGGQACGNVTVSGDGTELTCTTPQGTPGTAQVVVTNPNGGPGYGVFTYVNPTPTVTGVNPSSGVPAGGNTITIVGTGFIANATASVGGQACTSVNVQSSTTLTCVAPAGTEGTVADVTVTNVGPVAGTGVGLYTYRTPSATPLPLTTMPVATAPTTTVAPATTAPPSPSTTVPPAPVPATDGDLPALGSTEVLVTEDGEPVAVELVVENDEALVLRSQDFELRLRGACTTGCTITEDTTGRETIHLDRNGGARVSGFGFLPGSLVHVWIFSEPRYLGALLVAEDGSYDGTFPLDDIEVGGHTLQANGFSFDDVPRSANLGIVVVDSTVPAPGSTALPATGTTNNGMLWAALFIAAGIALIAPARRRRAV